MPSGNFCNGPCVKDDVETEASNLGLRRVEDFALEAAARGLILVETRAMPANNLMLLFRRR